MRMILRRFHNCSSWLLLSSRTTMCMGMQQNDNVQGDQQQALNVEDRLAQMALIHCILGVLLFQAPTVENKLPLAKLRNEALGRMKTSFPDPEILATNNYQLAFNSTNFLIQFGSQGTQSLCHIDVDSDFIWCIVCEH